MNKKKIAAIVAVFLIAGTAFASVAFEEIIPDIEVLFDFIDVPNGLSDEVEVNVDDEILYEDDEAYSDGNLIKDSDWMGDSETVSVLSALAEAVETTTDKESGFQMLRELASFEEEYSMDHNTREQFAQWISEGKDYRLLMYIYEYWINTNEDISIIADVYDMFVRNYDEEMRLPANRALWFEGIFNTLTGNKFGKITSDDIDKYMDSGLSLNDIKLAERISRAGVKNVHEILDEKADDKTWSSIAAEIYDMPELLSYPELDIMSLQDVLTLSKITGEKADVILAKVEDSSTEEIMNQHLIESQRRADNALIIAGLWEFNTPEEKKMVMEAMSNGVEPISALSDAKSSLLGIGKIESNNIVSDNRPAEKNEGKSELDITETEQDNDNIIDL